MASPQMNPFAEKLNSAKELASARETVLRELSVVVMGQQSSFWEKVSLFNAGAIALSINFAGSLHEHRGIKGFWVLVTAWIVMVCGMAAAFIRNKVHAEYRFYATDSSRLDANMKVQEAEIEFANSGARVIYRDSPERYDPQRATEIAKANLAKYKEAFEDVERRENRMFRRSTICQYLAAGTTLVGVACMIAVAVLNLR